MTAAFNIRDTFEPLRQLTLSVKSYFCSETASCEDERIEIGLELRFCPIIVDLKTRTFFPAIIIRFSSRLALWGIAEFLQYTLICCDIRYPFRVVLGYIGH